MRIFVAVATGVIGRRLVPMLVGNGHNVTAMTRSADKAPAIEAQGAEAAVTDVFDAERLTEAVGAARPEAVIDQLTDLPKAMNPRKAETELAGNDRIRTEGTRNLVAAARAAGASAFIAQSIAFAYRNDGDGLKTEDDPLALDAAWPWRRSVEACVTSRRRRPAPRDCAASYCATGSSTGRARRSTRLAGRPPTWCASAATRSWGAAAASSHSCMSMTRRARRSWRPRRRIRCVQRRRRRAGATA